MLLQYVSLLATVLSDFFFLTAVLKARVNNQIVVLSFLLSYKILRDQMIGNIQTIFDVHLLFV